MFKITTKTIFAIGIGAALFFVLGRFVSLPSPVENTNITLQYGLLAFIAAVWGPVAGALAGLIGHFFIDFSYGWGVWWSWVIASAVFGLILGLLCHSLKIGSGDFGSKNMIKFNVFQIFSHLIAWAFVAPVLDIVMYGEPADQVFIQGITGASINIITTAILGTLFCFGYSKIFNSSSSVK